MENTIFQKFNTSNPMYNRILLSNLNIDSKPVSQEKKEPTIYKTLIIGTAAVATLATIALLTKKLKKTSVISKRPAPVTTKETQTTPSPHKTSITGSVKHPVHTINKTVKENIDKLNKIRDQYRIDFNFPAKITDDGESRVLKALSNVKDKIYDEMRLANYATCGEKGIAEITEKSTKEVICLPVDYNNPWHFRQPKGLKAAVKGIPHPLERISLNVEPNSELIKKLDEYFVAHLDDVTGYYKTPTSFEKWFTRHDPITIYLYKPANQSHVLSDIAEIAKPYARSTGSNVLLGKGFGTCCAWQRSPQPSDYAALDKRILEAFGKVENVRSKPHLILESRLSAGEFCAYTELLNRITGKQVAALV